MQPMTRVQTYYVLVESLADAEEQVDDFDVHCEIPESLMEWNRLRFVASTNRRALFGFIRSNPDLENEIDEGFDFVLMAS